MVDQVAFVVLGLLLGWVVRDFLGKRKLDPSLIRAAAEQVEQVRVDLGRQVETGRADREADRQAFTELLNLHAARSDYWQTKCLNLVGGTSPGGRDQEVPPEPPKASPRDVANQYRMAVDGTEPDVDMKTLLDKGLTEAEAKAILSGDYENLPEGERLDLLLDESVRKSTGML